MGFEKFAETGDLRTTTGRPFASETGDKRPNGVCVSGVLFHVILHAATRFLIFANFTPRINPQAWSESRKFGRL